MPSRIYAHVSFCCHKDNYWEQMHPLHLRNLVLVHSAPRFLVSVLLGWHYNNKQKTTTDSIHPNLKKHIPKKSLLPLPNAHAFFNFAHTSSGHAAVQDGFSSCERLGSYNISNTEEEYDDVANNQLFFRAVTKDSTSSHFSETRIQPLKLGNDATLHDNKDIQGGKRRGGRTGALTMIGFVDGQFGMEQTCEEVIGLMRK
jgi:hypothetical protein